MIKVNQYPTTRQRKFFMLYFVEGKNSAYQAALISGYSKNTAKNAMKNVVESRGIVELLHANILTQENTSIKEITGEVILQKVLNIAQNSRNDSVKLRALELLGKRFSLWETDQTTREDAIRKFYESITSDNLGEDVKLLPDSEK